MLKGNAVTDPDLKVKTNGNTLSEVESVTFHGVEDIFRTCVRLSFVAKQLRRLSTPAEFSRKFIETCVLPLLPYRSPVILTELLC